MASGTNLRRDVRLAMALGPLVLIGPLISLVIIVIEVHRDRLIGALVGVADLVLCFLHSLLGGF